MKVTEEERRKIIETFKDYPWESCVGCGRSEVAYFLETGWSMLIWHTDIGPMCEYCYGNYEEPD